MPTLIICAQIAEDVYHDRPKTVQSHRPIHVPEREVFCAGNEFAA